jgi:hypothetical protein
MPFTAASSPVAPLLWVGSRNRLCIHDPAGVAFREPPQGYLFRIVLPRTRVNRDIDATIELDGTTSEVQDVCLEDLFVTLEEAERLSQGDDAG